MWTDMIASKIDEVYLVVLPATVRAMLSFFKDIVSFTASRTFTDACFLKLRGMTRGKA